MKLVLDVLKEGFWRSVGYCPVGGYGRLALMQRPSYHLLSFLLLGMLLFFLTGAILAPLRQWLLPEVLLLQSVAPAALLLSALCTRNLLALLLPLLLLGAGVLYSPLLHLIPPLLTVRAAPQQADAIVILGGGIECAGGVLSAPSQERLQEGMRLWRDGFAPTIVLSRQPDSARPCPKVSDVSAEIIRRTFPNRTVPLETLQNVRDTYEESKETARLVRAHGWHRVLLVTSAYHARRAALLFRRQGIVFTSVPAPLIPPSAGFVPTFDEQQTVMRELVAYLNDFVRGEL